MASYERPEIKGLDGMSTAEPHSCDHGGQMLHQCREGGENPPHDCREGGQSGLGCLTGGSEGNTCREGNLSGRTCSSGDDIPPKSQ